MSKGTLEELVLTRSVTKHIRKHNKKLAVGAGVGNDYSSVDIGEVHIITSEGVSDNPELAWRKAINNFSTSGGKILGVRILMHLPENVEEQSIKQYMNSFNGLADTEAIQIMGGHTELVASNASACFTVCVLGISGQYKANPKSVKNGDDIVMTKYTGLYGTNYLIDNCYEDLNKRFAKSYIDGFDKSKELLSIVKEAEISALDANVKYMHDVSRGGVYNALWQLGSRISKGIKVNHFDIPINQETIEFCEYYNLNPYMLEGTGSLLVVSADGNALVDRLAEAGIEAVVIGQVTDSNEKYVDTGTEKRFLAPVKGDELYKL